MYRQQRFSGRITDEESAVLGAGRLQHDNESGELGARIKWMASFMPASRLLSRFLHSHSAKLPPQNICPAPEDRYNKQR
eukprot:scaffold9861_cov65-Skeletonema_dohrnii-CCMP3373.AAC.1